MNNQPLVIIQCFVYNHELYLRQCLDGFVMQQTNFPFYAVVHDDASTDNSVAIIQEYVERYPEIIRPIYEKENQYSKNDGSVDRIVNEASTSAKYIAICEGDDYWIDPLKLQKQVDFLESHEDYAICFCHNKVYNQELQTFVEDTIAPEVPETTTILDLARGNYIHTPTVVYRNIPAMNVALDRVNSVMGLIPADDYARHMFNAQYGKIKKLPDCMAVYRIREGGIWSMQTERKKGIWLLEYYYLTPFFADEVKAVMTESFQIHYQALLKECVENKMMLNSVLNSHAFKLGKKILSPIKWLKSKIKRICN